MDIRLIVPEGKTTIIDAERHYIYGLKLSMSRDELMNEYLGVIGNGRIEISTGDVGTGMTVELYSNDTDNLLETYEVVIFGDVNGDGEINSTDVTTIRMMNAGLIDVDPVDAYVFAADLNADNNVNSSDVTLVRIINAGLSQYDQVARCLLDEKAGN